MLGHSTELSTKVRETFDDGCQREWIARPAALVTLRYGLARLGRSGFRCGAYISVFPFASAVRRLRFTMAITFWYGGIGPGALAALLSLSARFLRTEVDITSYCL